MRDCAAADEPRSAEVLGLTAACAAAAEAWEKWLPVQNGSSISVHFQVNARGFWFFVCVFQPLVAVPTLALVSDRFVRQESPGITGAGGAHRPAAVFA